MSDKSSIEWTDATWNPIRGTKGRHHCVRISEGCKHCYAATMNHRFGGPDYVKGADTPRLNEEALLQPLKWKAPRRIFVCSMTDLFMDEHPNQWIAAVFAIMAASPHHTFQVLTKRAARMRSWFEWMASEHTGGAVTPLRKANLSAHEIMRGRAPGGARIEAPSWPLPNVWLGVSAENQERADERIPDLLATPAAVRFVSAEPLLGPIRLDRLEEDELGTHYDALSGSYEGGDPEGPSLSWVIVGGESGPGARPCDVSWIRSIKDQCVSARVACFVKQLGAKPLQRMIYGAAIGNEGAQVHAEPLHLKDRKGGDPAEWPADLRVREMPR